MYSDISSLINLFSSPNIASAKALQSSVFPTPVGPKKAKDPIGLLGSLRPTLDLLTALDMVLIASNCPITLLLSFSSSLRSLLDSFSVSLSTGI